MAFCLILGALPAFGSGESKIAFDTVSMRSTAHDLEVGMTRKEGGEFDFQVKISDKIIKISPEFLFNAKDIDAESIRLIVVSNPGQKVRMADGFVVSFVVGGTYEHGKNIKGEDIKVCSVIRLHFDGGELTRSVMAVPSGDFKNEWHFLERARSPDGRVVDETDKAHVVASVRCPWATSVEPEY